MTPLRQQMIDLMVLKGYSPKTQKSYLYAVEKVARHFGRSPDTIDVGELERYFLYLLTEKGLASASVRLIVNGMRFLNNQVLQRPARDFLVRYPKRAQRIPELLTRDEVHRILSHTRSLKHHTLLATCYAAGLRVSELVHLRVRDIDSARDLVHIRSGKGNKDHQLNPWVQLHPEVLYAVLFKAVWHTLRSFGDDPKRLDGQLGMTAVLHTWGQNLSQHVHLHCLIPGGAYHREHDEWHSARSTYLFPVKALSRRYRGRMVSELRQAYDEGLLSQLTDAAGVERMMASLMETPWVVFARSTCQHSDTVLTYLARYTHRIAISNNRLETVDEENVVFRYKDYASGGTIKRMRLQGEEFVRRLLLHVLPHGMMRIRHYGFMANCCRRKRLEQIRHCLELDAIEGEDTIVAAREGRGYPIKDVETATTCPRCRRGILLIVGEIEAGFRRCCEAVM